LINGLADYASPPSSSFCLFYSAIALIQQIHVPDRCSDAGFANVPASAHRTFGEYHTDQLEKDIELIHEDEESESRDVLIVDCEFDHSHAGCCAKLSKGLP